MRVTGLLNTFFARYRLQHPSLLLLVLPYLAFNWRELIHSPFFSVANLSLIILAIAALDLLFKTFLLWDSRFKKPLAILLLAAIIVYFYGYYFVADLQKISFRVGKLPIRMRTLFVILFLFLVILQALFFNRKWFYKLLNIYLVLFSVLVFLTPSRQRGRTLHDVQSFKMHPVDLPYTTNSQKPVVLLVTDEYQSPAEMATALHDSSLTSFSDSLSANNWIVRNNFLSNETSTLHSISSLLNFNLSADTNYRKQSVIDIGAQKLSHPALIDSLRSKQVKFINFGIFNFGYSPALTALYFYPTNFLQHFLTYTSYFILKYNTGGFDINGFQEKYSPFEAHNKKILRSLSDTLASVKGPTFLYAHLMMPHQPFQYSPEFPLRLTTSLPDYKDYWKFTNTKLQSLLQRLASGNKYRIIVTGDHGFRINDSLNVQNTFSAYYGFDSSSVNTIKSVQDLGSLINHSFK